MFGSYILKLLLRTIFENIKIMFVFHVFLLFPLLFLFFRTETIFKNRNPTGTNRTNVESFHPF